jgi:outer membrane protein TolC
MTSLKHAAAGLILALLSAQAHAAQDHEDLSVGTNPQLTLSALATMARERHPDRGLVRARSALVEAETDFAGRWFPASTQLSGFHLSDRPLDDTGMYENEVALSFPLWMPGEKKSQSMLVERLSTSESAAEAEFQWQLSSQVRKSLWSLLMAKRQWELAVEQEGRLSAVLEQATIFAEAGDLAEGDRLAVVQELAVWKAETLSLEAEFQDAARHYRALTGATDLPERYLEKLNDNREIDADHPALFRAANRLEEVSARLEVLSKGNDFRPALQLFWRGTRPDHQGPSISALGVGFEIPLGRSPRKRPQVALANEELARAEALWLRLKRQLDLDLHEASHQLFTIGKMLENSHILIEAAERRYELDLLALELGEISTREWLRRLSEFRDIQQSHELLVMQQGAARAAFNQAVGETL